MKKILLIGIMFFLTPVSSVTPYLELNTEAYHGGYYYDVSCNNNIVFTACDDDGLRVYLFSEKLILLDTIDDGGLYRGVFYKNNIVYTACGYQGVRAYSFKENKLHLTAESKDGTDFYNKVFVDDNYVYVACVNSLKVYTKTLTLLDSYPIRCLDVWSKNQRVYTASGSEGLNVLYFDGIRLHFQYNINDGRYYLGIYGDDDGIYCACSTDGLVMYTPEGVKQRYDGGVNHDVYTDAKYIYASCGKKGLKVYTKTLHLVAEAYDGGIYWASTSNSSHIFTACDNNGLRVYSLKNIINPYSISKL